MKMKIVDYAMQLEKGLAMYFFNRVPQPLLPDTMALVMKRITGCSHIYANLLKRRRGELKKNL